jgi:hypothetical protein
MDQSHVARICLQPERLLGAHVFRYKYVIGAGNGEIMRKVATLMDARVTIDLFPLITLPPAAFAGSLLLCVMHSVLPPSTGLVQAVPAGHRCHRLALTIRRAEAI